MVLSGSNELIGASIAKQEGLHRRLNLLAVVGIFTESESHLKAASEGLKFFIPSIAFKLNPIPCFVVADC